MFSLKRVIRNIPAIFSIYNFVRNGLWKRGLIVQMGSKEVMLSGIHVRQNGKNNRLYLGAGVKICNCRFIISGNDNYIYIGDNCSLQGTGFYIEDNNNGIILREKTTITGDVDISAIEGTSIEIGSDCMLSSQIYISTGDGHSVCDANCLERTNESKSIKIGNHVWIGTQVIVGKGVHIGDNSIVAAGSVCTSSIENQANVIVGGNPASVVRRNVNWLRERIKV